MENDTPTFETTIDQLNSLLIQYNTPPNLLPRCLSDEIASNEHIQLCLAHIYQKQNLEFILISDFKLVIHGFGWNADYEKIPLECIRKVESSRTNDGNYSWFSIYFYDVHYLEDCRGYGHTHSILADISLVSKIVKTINKNAAEAFTRIRSHK